MINDNGETIFARRRPHRFSGLKIMLMIASDIRRLVLRASILLFASVLSTTACRATDQGKFVELGSGIDSCGKYLSEHAENELAGIAYLAWLQGYLTAFNHETPGVYNILEGTDIDGAIGWINNYCQQYPTDHFATAASKLIYFMMQKRRSEVSPPGLKENVFADLPPPPKPAPMDFWPEPAPMSSYVGDIAPDRPVSFNAPAQHGMGKPKLGPPVEGNPFDQFDKKPAESAQAEPGLPAAKSEVVTVKYRGPVSLAAFKCDTITRSSFIERVCYDEKNAYMLINLSGTWYHYCEIGRGTVSSLLAAESIGCIACRSIEGARDHRRPRS
jgi:hypothetical protein